MARLALTLNSEARQYASMIETRIILIDGAELARLMITLGVGVSTVATYLITKIDLDYFSDGEA